MFLDCKKFNYQGKSLGENFLQMEVSCSYFYPILQREEMRTARRKDHVTSLMVKVLGLLCNMVLVMKTRTLFSYASDWNSSKWYIS